MSVSSPEPVKSSTCHSPQASQDEKSTDQANTTDKVVKVVQIPTTEQIDPAKLRNRCIRVLLGGVAFFLTCLFIATFVRTLPPASPQICQALSPRHGASLGAQLVPINPLIPFDITEGLIRTTEPPPTRTQKLSYDFVNLNRLAQKFGDPVVLSYSKKLLQLNPNDIEGIINTMDKMLEFISANYRAGGLSEERKQASFTALSILFLELPAYQTSLAMDIPFPLDLGNTSETPIYNAIASCFVMMNSCSPKLENERYENFFQAVLDIPKEKLPENTLFTVVSDLLRLACSRHGEIFVVWNKQHDKIITEEINMWEWIAFMETKMTERFGSRKRWYSEVT